MAVKNFKASVSGSILTLKIDLSKDNGMNQKGTALKVAEAYWGDYAELGLPEGYSASLVIMRKPSVKIKNKKVVEDIIDADDEEAEEKPARKSKVAKKTSKKTATAPAKPTKATKPATKPSTKKTKPAANNNEDVEQNVFAADKPKRRAAA